MRAFSLYATCTQNGNRASFSCDVCYEGMDVGHRYGIFNAVATKDFGGDFTARYEFKSNYTPDVPLYYSYQNEYPKSTDGDSSVTWDTGPEGWLEFGAPAEPYTDVQVYVRFYVDWGDGETYADTSVVSLRPQDRQTMAAGTPRYLQFNANGGSLSSSRYEEFRFYKLSTYPSITIHRHNPSRSEYFFNRWDTHPFGSGTQYVDGDEWDGSGAESNGRLTVYAIWNPLIRFDANGGNGNGMPNPLVKTFDRPAAIPSTEPRHASKTFLSWNTSQSGGGTMYLPGGTIPANINTATTLYAQWRNPTPAPSISGASVIRCTSSGTQDDLGTYCRVTASWSVNRTYDSSNTGTLTGTIRGSDGTTRTITFDSGASGASGTATALVSGVQTDVQYTITLTLADTNTDTNHISTATRQTILTRAKFIMDFKAGGNAVGIGSAAPQSGLMVGYNTVFNGNVSVRGMFYGNDATWPVAQYQFNDSVTSLADIFVPTSGFTVHEVNFAKCGPIKAMRITLFYTASVTAGEWTLAGFIASDGRAAQFIPQFAPASSVSRVGYGYVTTGGNVYVYITQASGNINVSCTYF